MSVPAKVLAELGAMKRQFYSVKQAVLWYRRQAAKRLWTATVLEVGSAPRSEDARNSDNATYAAIAVCLKGIDHVPWLVGWYEGDGWGDGTWLATQANMTRWTFTRRCRKTERLLREKLESAGLMTEES